MLIAAIAVTIAIAYGWTTVARARRDDQAARAARRHARTGTNPRRPGPPFGPIR